MGSISVSSAAKRKMTFNCPRNRSPVPPAPSTRIVSGRAEKVPPSARVSGYDTTDGGGGSIWPAAAEKTETRNGPAARPSRAGQSSRSVYTRRPNVKGTRLSAHDTVVVSARRHDAFVCFRCFQQTRTVSGLSSCRSVVVSASRPKTVRGRETATRSKRSNSNPDDSKMPCER